MRTTADDRWLYAADVAKLLNTSVGNIYYLANYYDWHKRKRGRRAQYRLSDILNTPRANVDK